MKKIGILVVILFLLVPLGFSNVQADTMGNNSRTINSSISVNPDPIQGRNNVTVSANISGSAGDFQASNGEAVITIPKKNSS